MSYIWSRHDSTTTTSNSIPQRDRRVSQIRLVVLDVDGTMLNTRSGATSELVKLMRTPHRYGVDVTIATGRAYTGAIPTITHLKKRMKPIITYNGAMTIDPRAGQVLEQHSIDEDCVASVVSISTGHGFSPLVYDCTPVHVDRSKYRGTSVPPPSPVSETVFGFAAAGIPTDLLEPNGMSVRWVSSGQAVNFEGPVAVVIPVMGRTEAANQVRSELRRLTGVSITGSSSRYIEVRPAGVDKSTALKSLARLLGLTAGQIAAVGDNDNDVEMLRWAGFGIAVADASSSAVSASNYQTQFSAAGGVAELFQVIRHAHRYAKAFSARVPDTSD